MTILLRVLLNNTNTQMSQFDSGVIHEKLFSSVDVPLNKGFKMVLKIMHFIYFFADNINSLLNTLVHGKENDINVSI